MKLVQHINKRTSDQIAIDFPSTFEYSFHNTIELKPDELIKPNKQVTGVEQTILEKLFKINPGKSYTVYEVMEWLAKRGQICKESSIRARLNNLASLHKYKIDGINQVEVMGKRLDPKHSQFPNNCYGIRK